MKLGAAPVARSILAIVPAVLSAAGYALVVLYTDRLDWGFYAAVGGPLLLFLLSLFTGLPFVCSGAATAIAVWVVGFYDELAASVFFGAWAFLSLLLAALRAQQSAAVDKKVGSLSAFAWEFAYYQVFFWSVFLTASLPWEFWLNHLLSGSALVVSLSLLLLWAAAAERKTTK